MSKIELIRKEMVEAMKAKDKVRKDALSMLLSALKNAQIDKREELTEEEENVIIKKEMKQTQETYDTAPNGREDIRSEAAARLAVYQQYAPEEMNEDQINAVIQTVLTELGLSSPAASDKGKIMKELMPRVKGKADGKLVNQLLSAKFK